jgi:hypothetical protein
MVVSSSTNVRQSKQASNTTDSIRDYDDMLEKRTTDRWDGPASNALFSLDDATCECEPCESTDVMEWNFQSEVGG